MVDNHLLRHCFRNTCAKVFLDKCKGQVDAGRDACRGPDHTVFHVNAISMNIDRWVVRLQALGHSPMRRRAALVEQTCSSQQKGAGADACGSTGAIRRLGDERTRVEHAGACANAAAADDDECVRAAPTQTMGIYPHSGRTHDGTPVFCHDPSLIAARHGFTGHLEHGEWTAQIEQLKLGKDKEIDAMGHGRKTGKNDIPDNAVVWDHAFVNKGGSHP